ncbi:hypothetical protein CEUSTIGMA_g2764.t1 [Chlamydomonas eustigma]|uniref:Phosphodiesterase n=1 Tax=Chlamydomonas eustigma TaxID=1157962 RepID=A0A250WX93_9CHLO|nr:hypothetical protein CEUSTIGMA_g2764.t1 [Chlamydomonas eustigma]|eukprot:GAX75319.1 hypothetical protein CEUSTIGMA_g2764.t1 [Chlamydomonas eustigma]
MTEQGTNMQELWGLKHEAAHKELQALKKKYEELEEEMRWMEQEAAWLEKEKSKSDAMCERLKDSLKEALFLQDSSSINIASPNAWNMDMGTPALMALGIIEKFLYGEKVSVKEAMEAHNAITLGGHDLHKPLKLKEVLGVSGMDEDVNQALEQLLGASKTGGSCWESFTPDQLQDDLAISTQQSTSPLSATDLAKAMTAVWPQEARALRNSQIHAAAAAASAAVTVASTQGLVVPNLKRLARMQGKLEVASDKDEAKIAGRCVKSVEKNHTASVMLRKGGEDESLTDSVRNEMGSAGDRCSSTFTGESGTAVSVGSRTLSLQQGESMELQVLEVEPIVALVTAGDSSVTTCLSGTSGIDSLGHEHQGKLSASQHPGLGTAIISGVENVCRSEIKQAAKNPPISVVPPHSQGSSQNGVDPGVCKHASLIAKFGDGSMNKPAAAVAATNALPVGRDPLYRRLVRYKEQDHKPVLSQDQPRVSPSRGSRTHTSVGSRLIDAEVFMSSPPLQHSSSCLHHSSQQHLDILQTSRRTTQLPTNLPYTSPPPGCFEDYPISYSGLPNLVVKGYTSQSATCNAGGTFQATTMAVGNLTTPAQDSITTTTAVGNLTTPAKDSITTTMAVGNLTTPAKDSITTTKRSGSVKKNPRSVLMITRPEHSLNQSPLSSPTSRSQQVVPNMKGGSKMSKFGSAPRLGALTDQSSRLIQTAASTANQSEGGSMLEVSRCSRFSSENVVTSNQRECSTSQLPELLSTKTAVLDEAFIALSLSLPTSLKVATNTASPRSSLKATFFQSSEVKLYTMKPSKAPPHDEQQGSIPLSVGGRQNKQHEQPLPYINRTSGTPIPLLSGAKQSSAVLGVSTLDAAKSLGDVTDLLSQHVSTSPSYLPHDDISQAMLSKLPIEDSSTSTAISIAGMDDRVMSLQQASKAVGPTNKAKSAKSVVAFKEKLEESIDELDGGENVDGVPGFSPQRRQRSAHFYSKHLSCDLGSSRPDSPDDGLIVLPPSRSAHTSGLHQAIAAHRARSARSSYAGSVASPDISDDDIDTLLRDREDAEADQLMRRTKRKVRRSYSFGGNLAAGNSWLSAVAWNSVLRKTDSLNVGSMGSFKQRSEEEGAEEPNPLKNKDAEGLELCVNTNPVMTPPDKLARLLANIEEWQYDVFALEEVTQAHALSVLGFALITRTEAFRRFNMDADKLARFLMEVESGYTEKNYHCATHGADVLRTLHVLGTRGGIWRDTHCSEVGIIAMYLSAIVHDYEHVGFNNDFLIKTHNELSIRYNDRSPMENHHVASAWALLREDRHNFIENMPAKAQEFLRKLVIESVLATDMKQHFSLTSLFSSKASSISPHLGPNSRPNSHPGSRSNSRPTSAMPVIHKSNGAASNNNVTAETKSSAVNNLVVPESSLEAQMNKQSTFKAWDDDSRLLAMQMLLKTADLGHMAGPLNAHQIWVQKLEKEMFKQGDEERALGLPVSPLMDRDSGKGVTKSQTGFLNFVALPLYKVMAQAFPDCEPFLDAVNANYMHCSEQEKLI